jgi:hypothetical protein
LLATTTNDTPFTHAFERVTGDNGRGRGRRIAGWSSCWLLGRSGWLSFSYLFGRFFGGRFFGDRLGRFFSRVWLPTTARYQQHGDNGQQA